MSVNNLSKCPEALQQADANAEQLWPIFLKRVGLHLNGRGEVIENEGRTAMIVRGFGISGLIERLAHPASEQERARIWWRESIACSPGDSPIPDLSSENLYVVNAFIVTPTLRYPDPRVVRMADANRKVADKNPVGRPRTTEAIKRALKSERNKTYRAKLRKARKETFNPRSDANPTFPVEGVFASPSLAHFQ